MTLTPDEWLALKGLTDEYESVDGSFRFRCLRCGCTSPATYGVDIHEQVCPEVLG